MGRAEWRDFICAPERAGRHLSAIGRGVSGSKSDPIDLAVLQSFLDRLHRSADDVRLLGTAVDLINSGYGPFARSPLQNILDSLSNEMLAEEQVVGPALRGNPRWDRTLLQRMSGILSPVHYISRTSHRSFDLPENQLLSWLVADLTRAVGSIEQRVGTSALHPDLQALKADCDRTRAHHWFGNLPIPPRLTAEMIQAAKRHRRPEYRTAAALAVRRQEMETNDHHAWWYTILSLLAVNWLEPVSDDDLFELFVLVLAIDVMATDLGFGEPVEYGLVLNRRGHVALFDDGKRKAKVYFDQTPAAVLGLRSKYGEVIRQHHGIGGGERRPDILIVLEADSETRLVLVEMKKSSDGKYLSDSVYKIFGYLYDFSAKNAGSTVKALLVVPTGVQAAGDAPPNRAVHIASGDDRAGVTSALRAALCA